MLIHVTQNTIYYLTVCIVLIYCLFHAMATYFWYY
jgi:hypothetical protein